MKTVVHQNAQIVLHVKCKSFSKGARYLCVTCSPICTIRP